MPVGCLMGSLKLKRAVDAGSGRPNVRCQLQGFGCPAGGWLHDLGMTAIPFAPISARAHCMIAICVSAIFLFVSI